MRSLLTMKWTVALILCAAITCRIDAANKVRAPALDVSTEGFRAMIKEDERRAEVVPPIRVLPDTGPVCGYLLTAEKTGDSNGSTLSSIPFHVDVQDKSTGAGVLRVADGAKLDCSAAEYNLRIRALKCGDGGVSDAEASEAALLTVYVADVNDHAPYFPEPWYTTEVEEGRIYTQLISLRAVDDDCGHPYGEICHYEISNTRGLGAGSPFEVTDQGVLRNTAPLNVTGSASHVLSVVAVDCGMRRSKPTLLTINVRPKCDVKFKGIPDRTDYYPTTGAKWVMPDAQVDMCHMQCVPEKSTATVTLRTGHIGRGCDRDPLDDLHNRENCGLDSRTVDLLPRADGTGDQPDDRSDSGSESSEENSASAQTADEAYMFNGIDNAIVVPESTASPLVGDEFTLSFWMRHKALPGERKHNHKKENVVCASDEHKMSRHHFAVYVRNCKLEMLHRTEPADSPATGGAVFRPAEWRWKVAAVCDDRWHHYTITYNRSEAALHVDGRTHAAQAEVLDDVPLHNKLDGQLRLVLGACWHARQGTMSQHFAGYLASMLYLPGATQTTAAIQCLHKCNERLQFNGLEQLVVGEEAVFNAEMSSVTLSAMRYEDLAKLVQKVAYTNSRAQPTPGHRAVEIDASVKCQNRPEPLPVQSVTTYVIVQKAPQPTLQLRAAAAKLTKTHSQVVQGALMFDGLEISVLQPDAAGSPHDASPKHKLDWCSVHLLDTTGGQAAGGDSLRRRIDSDNEYFSSPAALVGQMRLDFEHDDYGLLLKGAERPSGYAQVLSQVRYFHMKPTALTTRSYALECAMLAGTVRSKPLVVEMIVVADPPTEAPVQDHQQGTEAAPGASNVHLEPNSGYDFDRLKSVLEIDMPAPQPAYRLDAGGVVAVVVIACIGVLLVLVIIGVLRARDVRSTDRRYRRAPNGEPGAGNDLAWDDTALSIRVNPLDDVEGELGAGAAAKLRAATGGVVPPLGAKLNAGFDMAGEATADDDDQDSGDETRGAHVGPPQSDTEYDTDDAHLPHATPCAKKGSGQSLEWEDDDQLCLPPPPAGAGRGKAPRC